MSTRHTTQSGAPSPTSETANRPAVNSSESPGRKKPMSRPHSAKMIAATPTSAHGPSQEMIVSGWSHAGPIAARVVVTTAEGTGRPLSGRAGPHAGHQKRDQRQRHTEQHTCQQRAHQGDRKSTRL